MRHLGDLDRHNTTILKVILRPVPRDADHLSLGAVLLDNRVGLRKSVSISGSREVYYLICIR
jgi:hypothetical protein